MKPASIVQLLEVGYLLYQKQNQFKNIFNINSNFLNKEIKLIIHVILIHMEIIQKKGKSIIIVNSDHYEYVTSMFWNYCEGQISETEMIDLIYDLKVEHRGVKYRFNGEPVMQIHSTHSINVLFRIKYSIQTKRSKFENLIGAEQDFLRAENEIMDIALKELGKKDYFFENSVAETSTDFEEYIH